VNDPENIVTAIYRAVDWINGELPPDRQLIKARKTRLLSSQSVLDSMHLAKRASPIVYAINGGGNAD
jgi:hypothetical protein